MTRRERLERKLERRREWAEKAEHRSDQHYETGHKMLDAIPMGQPILIGHHSEKRDRAYRERAGNHMSKFVAERKLAEHHEQKADGLEHQLDRSIFSDDENAIEELEIRIKNNETKRAHMKEVNRLYRKGDVASLAGYGINLDQLRETLKAKGGYWGSAPHLAYEFQNLGQRIIGDKKRIEEIKRRMAKQAEAEATPNGVTIKGSGEWVSVTFAEKPSREILNALRTANFHWGGGSWSGRQDALPQCVAELLEVPKVAEAE